MSSGVRDRVCHPVAIGHLVRAAVGELDLGRVVRWPYQLGIPL